MEPLNQTSIMPVRDATQVAVARRAVTDLAEAIGMEEARVSAANIIVVELANNLLQHAGGGEMYIRVIESARTIDIAAVDHGPGIFNIDQCLQDGYSTASTPGLGLGAVSRFARRFNAFSIPGRTTVVAARMSQAAIPPDFSVVCTAMHGETRSGDSWCVSDDGLTYMVVDGLGHGMLAADAAAAATRTFAAHQDCSPAELMERLHAALRPTRGAAGAVARIDRATRTVSFAGIGNITAILMSQVGSQSCVSHNGTLGHQLRRVQQFEYRYTPGTLLVMQSDGLSTHAKTQLPPTIAAEEPHVLAPLFYAEQVRGRDDATVLVGRLG